MDKLIKNRNNKAVGLIPLLAVVFSLFIFMSSPSYATVNGACGSASGGKFDSMPTQPAAKCARGLDTATTQSGTNWRWQCQGSGGGTTATCNAAQCGSVDADCKTFSGYFSSQPASTTTNACNIGDYVDTADTATLWNWNCNGRGSPAGTNAGCSANRATTENGACKAISGYYSSQPATSTASGCDAGSYIDLATDTATQWQWRCNGAGTPVGTNSPTCTANRATTVNGSCKAISGYYASQPATTTGSGCDAGSYVDLADSGTQWQWRCNGGGTPAGTNSTTCTANKATTVNGACKAISGNYASQPATTTASGCDAGSYVDLADSGTQWQWRCNGTGTPAGTNSPTCTANKATTVNGACKVISGNYASQPATSTASGCDAGSYVDLADSGTQWQWRCNGTGTPVGTNSPTCTANKATTINGVCNNATRNACTSGTPNDAAIADTSTEYRWRCDGAGSPVGTNSGTCSKLKPINGVCNNATQNACSAGTPNDAVIADTSTEYRWRCDGQNGGTNSGTCSLAKPPSCPNGPSGSAVNGTCGVHHGESFSSTPSGASSLCLTGSASSVSLSGSTYSWTCNGVSGGSADSCSASKGAAGYWGGNPTSPFGIQYGTSPDIAWSQFTMDCGAIDPSACQGCTSFPAVTCTPGAACDPAVDTRPCLINQRSCSSGSIDATVWDRYQCTTGP